MDLNLSPTQTAIALTVFIVVAFVALACFAGWLITRAQERKKLAELKKSALRAEPVAAASREADAYEQRLKTNLDEYQKQPVQREVVKNVTAGYAFGKLAYEDVPIQFLDSFLLKYFWSIMKVPDMTQAIDKGVGPWLRFCETNSWAKGMPELFWQLTGYKPDAYQLNAVVVEYCQRMAKLEKV